MSSPLPVRVTILANTTSAELLRVYNDRLGLERLPIIAWQIEYVGNQFLQCLPLSIEPAVDMCVEFVVTHGCYYVLGEARFETQAEAIRYARTEYAQDLL